MRPIKTNGMRELRGLKKRILSTFALGRIARLDADYLLERIKDLETRIVSMPETDENGEEIG